MVIGVHKKGRVWRFVWFGGGEKTGRTRTTIPVHSCNVLLDERSPTWMRRCVRARLASSILSTCPIFQLNPISQGCLLHFGLLFFSSFTESIACGQGRAGQGRPRLELVMLHFGISIGKSWSFLH